jgi:adenylate kinase
MIIIMLGAPGAGKGTQSELLKETLQLVHISSGDLLRDNIKRETELGKIAYDYMNVKATLVPDDLVIAMILERLELPDAERGVLLDGFPRTAPQAAALTEALEFKGKRVSAALYIRVDDETLVGRLSGRWICRKCGHIYHEKFAPPRVHGVCDIDGGELYQREDDTREKAKKRVQVFHEETEPIIEYYRQRGVLCEVDGDRYIEVVTEELLDCLR